jgi:hypothetical protein
MPEDVASMFLSFIQTNSNWSKFKKARQAVQAIVAKIIDIPSGLRFLLVSISLMGDSKTINKLVLDFFYLVRLCNVYVPTMFVQVTECQHLIFRNVILYVQNYLMDSKLGSFIDGTQDKVKQLVYSHWQRVGLEFLVTVLEDEQGSELTKEEQFQTVYSYVLKVDGRYTDKGPFTIVCIHKLELTVLYEIFGNVICFISVRPDSKMFIELQGALTDMKIISSFDLYSREEEVIDYSIGEFDPVKEVKPEPPPIGFLSEKKEIAEQFLNWFPRLNGKVVDLSSSECKVSVYVETVPDSFEMEDYCKRMKEILAIDTVGGVIFTYEEDFKKWEMYQFLYAISCLYDKGILIRKNSDCSSEWIELFLESLRVWFEYY